MKSNTARLEVIKAAAERRRKINYERTGMLSLDVLPDEPIPAGSYLVHNHVRPQKPLNANGFRAWIQTKADNLVKCRCRFGGCKNSKAHKVHYRVDLGDKDACVPSPDRLPPPA